MDEALRRKKTSKMLNREVFVLEKCHKTFNVDTSHICWYEYRVDLKILEWSHEYVCC